MEAGDGASVASPAAVEEDDDFLDMFAPSIDKTTTNFMEALASITGASSHDEVGGSSSGDGRGGSG